MKGQTVIKMSCSFLLFKLKNNWEIIDSSCLTSSDVWNKVLLHRLPSWLFLLIFLAVNEWHLVVGIREWARSKIHLCFFWNQTCYDIGNFFLLRLLEVCFSWSQVELRGRQKQGLTNKGPVWIMRSMGCVPSLWKPLHRGMQGQVCLASLHSDYSSCRQAVCIKPYVPVSLEINWYVTPRRLS